MQAAWDFVKKLDESQQFEFTVVNPSYIQGPLLSASSGEVSQEFCLRLLNGSLPAVPDLSYDFIDVRDVAAAHIAAMENGDAMQWPPIHSIQLNRASKGVIADR